MAIGSGQARHDPEVVSTITGTNLVIAHIQEVLRIN